MPTKHLTDEFKHYTLVQRESSEDTLLNSSCKCWFNTAEKNKISFFDQIYLVLLVLCVCNTPYSVDFITCSQYLCNDKILSCSTSNTSMVRHNTRIELIHFQDARSEIRNYVWKCSGIQSPFHFHPFEFFFLHSIGAELVMGEPYKCTYS